MDGLDCEGLSSCEHERDMCGDEKMYFGEITGCEVEKDNSGYVYAIIRINKRKKIELFQKGNDEWWSCITNTDEIEYFEIDGKDILNDESNNQQ